MHKKSVVLSFLFAMSLFMTPYIVCGQNESEAEDSYYLNVDDSLMEIKFEALFDSMFNAYMNESYSEAIDIYHEIDNDFVLPYYYHPTEKYFIRMKFIDVMYYKIASDYAMGDCYLITQFSGKIFLSFLDDFFELWSLNPKKNKHVDFFSHDFILSFDSLFVTDKEYAKLTMETIIATLSYIIDSYYVLNDCDNVQKVADITLYLIDILRNKVKFNTLEENFIGEIGDTVTETLLESSELDFYSYKIGCYSKQNKNEEDFDLIYNKIIDCIYRLPVDDQHLILQHISDCSIRLNYSQKSKLINELRQLVDKSMEKNEISEMVSLITLCKKFHLDTTVDQIFKQINTVLQSRNTVVLSSTDIESLIGIASPIFGYSKIGSTLELLNSIRLHLTDVLSIEKDTISYIYLVVYFNNQCAAFLQYMHDYSNAIRLCDMALNAASFLDRKHSFNKSQELILSTYLILSVCYIRTEQYEMLREKLSFIDDIDTVNVELFPEESALFNSFLALAEFRLGLPEEAKIHADNAYCIFQQHFNRFSPEGKVPLAKALCEASLIDKAEEVLRNALEDYWLLRDFTPSYGTANQLMSQIRYINIVLNAIDKSKYEEFKSYLQESTEAFKSYYKNLLTSSTEEARTNEWNEIIEHFSQFIPAATTSLPLVLKDSLFADTMIYNAALCSKGILLESERRINDILIESNDTSTFSLLSECKRLKSEYSALVGGQMDNLLELDSMHIQIINFELQIISILASKYHIGDALFYNYSDIIPKLNKNECALEFVCYFDFWEPNIKNYEALILKQGMRYPVRVRFPKDILANISLLWRIMEPYLNDVKTIFFSPAGELYNIAIESLPDYEDSTRLISDRYNLYRLSSTRELAKDKKKVAIKNSNSFGGLRYDSKIDNSEQGVDKQKSFTYFPWSADSVSAIVFEKMPGYLPGSLSEVLYVDSIMGEASISSVIDTGINGTEAKFKSLSGSNTNLLLISTHGFYFNGIQEIKQDRESIVGEDKSMTRSGLLFSGANNTFRNPRANTDTYNDGILTAQEIAQMDLKNVDLVVLSACETGLGELKGDGVFGLQRGFKKAGVNSIIMSLWKVDDLATKYLMTQFYENWLIKKMPKQKALKAAQDFVRNFEVEDDIKWAAYRKKNKADKGVAGGQKKTTQNGKKPETARDASKDNNVGHKGKRMKPFEDPDNWAAFILLDGLD